MRLYIVLTFSIVTVCAAVVEVKADKRSIFRRIRRQIGWGSGFGVGVPFIGGVGVGSGTSIQIPFLSSVPGAYPGGYPGAYPGAYPGGYPGAYPEAFGGPGYSLPSNYYAPQPSYFGSNPYQYQPVQQPFSSYPFPAQSGMQSFGTGASGGFGGISDPPSLPTSNPFKLIQTRPTAETVVTNTVNGVFHGSSTATPTTSTISLLSTVVSSRTHPRHFSPTTSEPWAPDSAIQNGRASLG